MKYHDAGYPYWSIDVPGLDEEDAKELVLLAGERSGNGATVIDPSHWLTLHMDRETVEIIASALRQCGDEKAQSLLEEMDEWLAQR